MSSLSRAPFVCSYTFFGDYSCLICSFLVVFLRSAGVSSYGTTTISGRDVCGRGSGPALRKSPDTGYGSSVPAF
jgi:hypothetical protein